MPIVYMALKVNVDQEAYDKLKAKDEEAIAELATVGDDGTGCVLVYDEVGTVLWERKRLPCSSPSP